MLKPTSGVGDTTIHRQSVQDFKHATLCTEIATRARSKLLHLFFANLADRIFFIAATLILADCAARAKGGRESESQWQTIASSRQSPEARISKSS